MEAILTFIISIALLVTVHELGHYLVARICGVSVLRFSVGFGKVIFQKRSKRNTQFALCMIPLGGYVEMLSVKSKEFDESRKHESYECQSVLKRMAIVSAGPFINIVLAVVLFTAVLLANGESGIIPRITKVESNSIAESYGLANGQKIVAIDGVVTNTLNKVLFQLSTRLGDSGTVKFDVVEETGREHKVLIPIKDWNRDQSQSNLIRSLGLDVGFEMKPILGSISSSSPADLAGLQPGDTIISIDGHEITSWSEAQNIIYQSPSKTLSMKILRNGSRSNVHITPRSHTQGKQTYGSIGVTLAEQEVPINELWQRKYSVFEAIQLSVNYTYKTAIATINSIYKIISGQLSTKNVSGVFGMASASGKAYNTGFSTLLGFLAVVSVGLAIFNFLPIPMLDGGQFLFLMIEAVKGTPLNETVQIWTGKIGVAILICLFSLGMFNDLFRTV